MLVACGGGCLQDFLGRGPADPYTRFIPPDEFQQLTKYDVSGAGVNLVGAEDFVNKLARPLPRGRLPADGGAWVVGLVKVSPPPPPPSQAPFPSPLPLFQSHPPIVHGLPC